MLNRIRNVFVVASFPLLALGGAACGGTVTGEAPATAQQAATKAPIAQDAHGPVKLIGAALGEVPLRPTQRTEIEKLAADAEARHQAGGAERKALLEAVAAQVEAGKIDRAALQPKIDAAAAAFAKNQDADRAAFEKLHDILDSDQRAAFVAAVQAKLAEMKAEWKSKGDDQKGEHRGARRGGPMREWATALKLTDDQKKQIWDAMKDKFKAMHAADGDHKGHEGFRGREMGKKVLEAFKGDKFVMNDVAPKIDAKAAANKMSDRMLGMLEVALPILTPEQRTLAAQKIRTDMATHARVPGL